MSSTLLRAIWRHHLFKRLLGLEIGDSPAVAG